VFEKQFKSLILKHIEESKFSALKFKIKAGEKMQMRLFE